MSNERHIRDIMLGDIVDRISNHAMCGDNGDKVVFSIPSFSTCTRCRERWFEEKAKDPIKHKFRLKMHGVINGGSDLDSL